MSHLKLGWGRPSRAGEVSVLRRWYGRLARVVDAFGPAPARLPPMAVVLAFSQSLHERTSARGGTMEEGNGFGALAEFGASQSDRRQLHAVAEVRSWQ